MHLFSKENIWSNPHASSIHPVIQTSTIILWTELFPKKRRDPRRDSSIYLRVQNTVVFPHFYKNYKISSNTVYSTVFPHAIQQLQVSTINSTYRINSSPRNTTTTRLIPCRLLPATVPRVSKHSTRQNKAPSFLTVFQGHTG